MSTRQRWCLAVRLGNWRQSPLLITKCRKFPSSCSSKWDLFFSFNNSFCGYKESITEPLPLQHMTNFLISLMECMHFSTQQIITSNLESYHILIIEKRFPVWANEYTITRFFATFPAALLKKVALYLPLLLSNNPLEYCCGYHKFKFLYSMNKHQRS